MPKILNLNLINSLDLRSVCRKYRLENMLKGTTDTYTHVCEQLAKSRMGDILHKK